MHTFSIPTLLLLCLMTLQTLQTLAAPTSTKPPLSTSTPTSSSNSNSNKNLPCQNSPLPSSQREVSISSVAPTSSASVSCMERSGEGDTLSIKFTARLYDSCEVIDFTSMDEVVDLELWADAAAPTNADDVVKGLHRGLRNMCVGSKRKLTIPSHLGFGEEGLKKSSSNMLILDVPQNAGLIYEVELVELKKAVVEEDRLEDGDLDDVLDDNNKKKRGFRHNSPRGSKQRSANRKRTNHPLAKKGVRKEKEQKEERMRRRRRMATMGSDKDVDRDEM